MACGIKPIFARFLHNSSYISNLWPPIVSLKFYILHFIYLFFFSELAWIVAFMTSQTVSSFFLLLLLRISDRMCFICSVLKKWDEIKRHWTCLHVVASLLLSCVGGNLLLCLIIISIVSLLYYESRLRSHLFGPFVRIYARVYHVLVYRRNWSFLYECYLTLLQSFYSFLFWRKIESVLRKDDISTLKLKGFDFLDGRVVCSKDRYPCLGPMNLELVGSLFSDTQCL